MVLAIGAASVLLPGSPAAQDGRALVERVRAYIDRFEQEVSALVAEEQDALRVERVDRRGGLASLVLVEPNQPTIVRTPDGHDVLSSGEFTVRIGDGAIVAATLRFRFPGSRMRDASTMTVEYGDVQDIPVLVPLRMSEALPMDDGLASGLAEYSNYRRFETTSRIR